MSNEQDARDAQSAAVEKLRQANTPRHRQDFRDAHRRIAEIEMQQTRDRLYREYRKLAREADSPQVDLEAPGDYRKIILENT